MQPNDEIKRVDELRDEILRTRNTLYSKGGTVIFSQILCPILSHGSSLIYAPDETLVAAAQNMGKVKGAMKNFFGPSETFGTEAELASEANLPHSLWCGRRLAQDTFIGVEMLDTEHLPELG